MCLAVPGKIDSIHDARRETRRGHVDFGGIRKEVNLVFVPDADVGDFVLVHVGFALSKIDEREATRVLEYLREMDELADLDSP